MVDNDIEIEELFANIVTKYDEMGHILRFTGYCFIVRLPESQGQADGAQIAAQTGIHWPANCPGVR